MPPPCGHTHTQKGPGLPLGKPSPREACPRRVREGVGSGTSRWPSLGLLPLQAWWAGRPALSFLSAYGRCRRSLQLWESNGALA